MCVDRVDLVALSEPFPLSAGETTGIGVRKWIRVGFGHPVVALLEHWTGSADLLAGSLSGDTHLTGDRLYKLVVEWLAVYATCCTVGPPLHVSRASIPAGGSGSAVQSFLAVRVGRHVVGSGWLLRSVVSSCWLGCRPDTGGGRG